MEFAVIDKYNITINIRISAIEDILYLFDNIKYIFIQ
jgi:hypothetical protein